jgi:alpha-ribazole phosphatase
VTGQATAKPPLWLLRHALPVVTPPNPSHPAANAHCYGHTDWPAHPEHTRQAALRVVAALVAQAPQLGTRRTVRSSTLQRCKQLTQCLQAIQPDWTYIFDERLTEMHFGRWEGLPWDEVPRTELDAWAADFAHCPVGHTGESVHRLVQRVAQVAPHAHGPDRTDDLWVTHAGVIRAMQWLQARAWSAIGPDLQAAHWPAKAPAYGDWVALGSD